MHIKMCHKMCPKLFFTSAHKYICLFKLWFLILVFYLVHLTYFCNCACPPPPPKKNIFFFKCITATLFC